MPIKYENLIQRPGYLCKENPVERIDFSDRTDALPAQLPAKSASDPANPQTRIVATEEALRDMEKTSQQLLVDIHDEIMGGTPSPYTIQLRH